jgi:hypothetical protein
MILDELQTRCLKRFADINEILNKCWQNDLMKKKLRAQFSDLNPSTRLENEPTVTGAQLKLTPKNQPQLPPPSKKPAFSSQIDLKGGSG